MEKPFLNVNYLIIILLNILLLLFGFDFNSSAQPDELILTERASIKKCGLIYDINEQVSYDIDISSGYIYTGGGTLTALHGTISGAFAAAAEEIKIENAESLILSRILQGWDFNHIFQNTFNKIIREAPVEIYIFNDTINRKDIRKGKTEFLNLNINTILKIKVNEYGIILVGNDLYTVYIKANYTITDLTDNKVLAFNTIKYNPGFIKLIQKEDKQSFKNSKEYKNNGVSPDSLFRYNSTEASYYDFVKDDARLLKKELKLASLETCRGIFSFLFLGDGRKTEWINDYRIIPSKDE
jgi:hypothetical protein